MAPRGLVRRDARLEEFLSGGLLSFPWGKCLLLLGGFLLREGVLLPAVEMCVCWFRRRRLERRVSTKDRARSFGFYSGEFGPVHGYRSQPPLARCPAAESPKRAPLERQRLAKVDRP